MPHRQEGVERTYLLPGRAEPLRLQTKEDAQQQHSLVPGFVRAEQIVHMQQFPPPKVPPDFEAVHHFPPETDKGKALLTQPGLAVLWRVTTSFHFWIQSELGCEWIVR